MKKLTIAFLTVAAIAFMLGFGSCKKKSPTKSETLDFSNFYGITKTDDNGGILTEDGDWCLPGQYVTTFGPAYPNPATDSCTINIAIPSFPNISVNVYNTSRTLIRALFNGPASDYQFTIKWDLNDNHGNRVPSGLYRVFFVADNFTCHGDIQVVSPGE